MDKASLRGKYGILRSEMPIEEAELKSLAIFRRLQALVDWTTVNSIHIYSPLAILREVDTEHFITYILKNAPGVRLTVSDAGKGSPIPDEQFQVVIAPLLAFDDQGNRLGFGGGWYDRFLASQKNVVSIGLAYEFQRVESLKVESHDQPLDYIVTDVATYGRLAHTVSDVPVTI